MANSLYIYTLMRWLRYPAALTVALALSISAAMLIGRAQPLPERVALLHLNDMCKLPCWIGITPGVTTLNDAVTRIKDVYGKLPNFNLHCATGACELTKGTLNFGIAFDTMDQRANIQEVGLSNTLSGDYLTIDEIYGVLGAPDLIMPHLLESFDSAALIYTDQCLIIYLHFTQNRIITQNGVIDSIGFGKNLLDREHKKMPVEKWQGFGEYP